MWNGGVAGWRGASLAAILRLPMTGYLRPAASILEAASHWGVSPLIRTRAALLASACLVPVLAASQAAAQGLPGAATRASSSAPVAGGTISAIRVEGNQRIEQGTVRSYMLVQPGDPFDPDRMDRSLKTLFATGLFSDVTLRRDGTTLVVHLVENPIVNRVIFEGNKKLSDDTLRPEVQLRSRSVYTPAAVQADRQRILDLYARRGRFGARVEPKIIQQDQNRVDVLFEISDGDSTLISRIAFLGNHAFGEDKLREVIGSRQEALWRFLSTSDNYDPDRVNFDKELLRRFYLKNGFADFEVSGANAELAPDRSAFFLTFTLDEGVRYRVSSVKVNSTLRNITGDQLRPLIETKEGDWYDGDAVERAIQLISDEVQRRGDPFVEVKPRIARDKEKRTVELVFDVNEGPRVYVERIDIVGNTRTEDKVVRREFRLAEGDAFNAELIRRSRQRLQDLGYFESANLTSSPGSAADKSIVNANISEKATGELTLGGGYSTDAGALVNAGIRERNLVGSGIDANLNGVLAQLRSEIDFSLTDPYFLDQNIVAGFDLFRIANNNQIIAQYQEARTGFSLRLGYEFNEHLRQAWTYSLVQRDVTNVATNASLFVQDEKGQSLLSQIGQTLTIDYRDSQTDPHSGFVIRTGADYAGLGGSIDYVRTKIDGTYFIPLEAYLGDPEWGFAISAGSGYLFNLGHRDRIIDRFFLGGDNLRGFLDGGAGPHSVGTLTISQDSIGGRFIWTQSTELHFPLPISPDLGLTGRAFVDVGSLSGVSAVYNPATNSPVAYYNDHMPRVGVGVGVSWKTPFGLINIDLADPVVRKKYDQQQTFRFGFGTRF